MAQLNINLIKIDYFFVAYKNMRFTAGTDELLLFSFLISTRYYNKLFQNFTNNNNVISIFSKSNNIN